MTVKWLDVVKLCHYALCGIVFISLFVLCYFLYMDEAIEKSKKKATTTIRRSEERDFEIPTLIICPESGFKPSISKKYNLSNPARYMFNFEDNSIRGYVKQVHNFDNLYLGRHNS